MNHTERSAFIGPAVPLSRSRFSYLQTRRSVRSVPLVRHTSRNVLYACAPSAPMDKLLNVARDQLSRSGLEITSMQWNDHVLTLFVMRENGAGVTADDCADASALVGEVIEQGKYLGDAAYTLQVSTPGAAEVLTQEHEFEAFRGFPVCVTTREAIKGKKAFWGTLADCSEKTVHIGVKGRVIKFRRQDVQEIRLCTAQQVQEASST